MNHPFFRYNSRNIPTHRQGIPLILAAEGHSAERPHGPAAPPGVRAGPTVQRPPLHYGLQQAAHAGLAATGVMGRWHPADQYVTHRSVY